MTPAEPDLWSAMHLLHDRADARLQLIVRHLPDLLTMLDDPPMFLVDLGHAEGSTAHVLEVAVRSPDDRNAIVEEWIAARLAGGDIVDAWRPEVPFVLQPESFPGGVVPAAYAAGLAHSSARAIQLLDHHAVAGRAPDDVVAAEVLALHRGMDPRGGWRSGVRAHATWIEELAGGPPAGGTPPDVASKVVAPALLDAYEGLGDRLGVELAAAGPSDDALQRFLVARLAHIHALRLLGPYGGTDFAREARILRALADSLDDE